MAQELLTQQVMHRLQELGLPPALIDVGDFRDNFFRDHWVMFVRDRDKVADVHLIQPTTRAPSANRG
jgi:hypothetical protein